MNFLQASLLILGLVLSVQSATVSPSGTVAASVSTSTSVSGSSSLSVSSSGSGSGSPSNSLTPSTLASASNSLSISSSTAASASRSGSTSVSASLVRNVGAGCQCDPTFDICCNANCTFQAAGELCGTQDAAGDCYLGRQCTTTRQCLNHYKVPGTSCTPPGASRLEGTCKSDGTCLNPNTDPVKVGPILRKQIVGKKNKNKRKLPKDVPFHLLTRTNNGRRTRRHGTTRGRH